MVIINKFNRDIGKKYKYSLSMTEYTKKNVMY